MTEEEKNKLLDQVNPQVFTDGKELFKKYMDEYVVHQKGLFILAPSGSGKTHFVNNQKEKHWIDGDILWCDAKAQPLPQEEEWWAKGIRRINEIEQKCDVITTFARKLGLWLMGSSIVSVIPDAVVIPDWVQHQDLIRNREVSNYDGGATSSDFEQVLRSRNYMENIAMKNNIPIFQSIQDAVDDLAT